MADTVFLPDDGIKKALQNMVATGGVWDGAVVRLYTNNVTPTDASVVGDFTEAVVGTFPGYAAISLAAASWGAVTVAAHVASSAYAVTLAYTRSSTGAALNTFGWYVTDAGKTKVYAAARFAGAPLTVTTVGDQIQIQNLTATCQSVN